MSTSESEARTAVFEGREEMTGAAERSLKFTGDVIKRWGPRVPGGKVTAEVAGHILEEMKKVSDSAWSERFRFTPLGFLSFLSIGAALYILALISLFMGWVVVAAIILALSGAISILEFVFYREAVDWALPHAEGNNVIGQIEPEGEVKQQIIVSGHHDSAYIFTYLERCPKYYFLRTLSTYLLVMLITAATIVAAVWQLATGATPEWVGVLRWIMVGGLVMVLPLFFFLDLKGTPGAGDNLIATAMALELGRYFKGKKDAGEGLKHTRLWIVSFDAEEAGLRGSRAFVKEHEKELKEVPTYLYNVDSVYELKHLKFITADLNGTMPLSPGVYNDLVAIANDLGYQAQKLKIIIGAGATDAAEFAKVGIEGSTLIAMRSETFMTDVAYHTSRDTVDAIEPQAVVASLEIGQAFVHRRDSGIAAG